MPKTNDLRAKLIERGIKNLKEFGYPDVNAENILTDMVYSRFFRSMLDDPENRIPSFAAFAAYEETRLALIAEIDDREPESPSKPKKKRLKK